MSEYRGLLAGITNPKLMAEVAERSRIVGRLAEQIGGTRQEAADHLFRFEAITTSEGQMLH